jgi:hypothetical protein
MPGMNKPGAGRAPEDLLGGPGESESGVESDAASHSAGILPSQKIEHPIRASKEIVPDAQMTQLE